MNIFTHKDQGDFTTYSLCSVAEDVSSQEDDPPQTHDGTHILLTGNNSRELF